MASYPAIAQHESLIYSSWWKVCAAAHEPDAGRICRIGRNSRATDGMPFVAVVLNEQEGGHRSVLQVSPPLEVLLPRGTRVLVDRDEASAAIAQFQYCTTSG